MSAARFRSLVALAAVLLVAALLPASAADASSRVAAHKRHFAQLYTCGTSDDSDHLGSASDLEARVNLGHWAKPASPGHPCAGGKPGTKFVPSATGIKFTFRWYAGKTLLRTSHGTVEVHPGGRYDDLHRNLVSPADNGHWVYQGKQVLLKVTIAKAGYATKVVTLKWFPGVE